MKTFLVVQAIEVLGESPQDAVDRLQEIQTSQGFPYYVQEANGINQSAIDGALIGAVEVVAA
jgi:hypothetical protein